MSNQPLRKWFDENKDKPFKKRINIGLGDETIREWFLVTPKEIKDDLSIRYELKWIEHA